MKSKELLAEAIDILDEDHDHALWMSSQFVNCRKCQLIQKIKEM